MKYFEFDLLQNFNVSYIGQVRYEAFLHFERRILNEYILYFIKEGEMFIEEERTRFHLQKGDFLLLEPNCKHKGYAVAEVQYYYIHIEEAEVLQLNHMSHNDLHELVQTRQKNTFSSHLITSSYKEDAKCLLPKTHCFKHYYEVVNLLDRVCYELNHKDESFKLYCVLLTKQIIIQLTRQFNRDTLDTVAERSRSTVKKLINYLEENVSEKLSIADVEVYSELNYDYLNRLFKARTNYTIKAYFNMLKIQEAQRLIAKRQMNFFEVGERIGISDPYYFSKFFKDRTGMTPSQYKKEIYFSERD